MKGFTTQQQKVRKQGIRSWHWQAKKDSGKRKLINKSLIPSFGMYVRTIANEPKVGIKLLLIIYLLPKFFGLASARILLLVSLLFSLYSESLRSQLTLFFIILEILTYHKVSKVKSIAVDFFIQVVALVKKVFS